MANVPSQSVLDVALPAGFAPSVGKSANAEDARVVTLRIPYARYGDTYIITPPLGVAVTGPNKGKPVERWIKRSDCDKFAPCKCNLPNGKTVDGLTITARAIVFTSRGITIPSDKPAKARKPAVKKATVTASDTATSNS